MDELIIRITDKLFINDDCSCMTEETMESILSEFNYINTLVIIGGEVMLSYNELVLLFKTIYENNIHIGHIKLLTTGTIYDKKIYNLLDTFFYNKYSVGIINSPKLDELIDIMYPIDEECSNNPYMNPKNSKDVINNIKKHYFNSHSIGWVNEEEFKNIVYIDIEGNLYIKGNNDVTERRQAMFNIRRDLFHSLNTNTGEEFIKKLNYDEYMRV